MLPRVYQGQEYPEGHYTPSCKWFISVSIKVTFTYPVASFHVPWTSRTFFSGKKSLPTPSRDPRRPTDVPRPPCPLRLGPPTLLPPGTGSPCHVSFLATEGHRSEGRKGRYLRWVTGWAVSGRTAGIPSSDPTPTLSTAWCCPVSVAREAPVDGEKGQGK